MTKWRVVTYFDNMIDDLRPPKEFDSENDAFMERSFAERLLRGKSKYRVEVEVTE